MKARKKPISQAKKGAPERAKREMYKKKKMKMMMMMMKKKKNKNKKKLTGKDEKTGRKVVGAR